MCVCAARKTDKLHLHWQNIVSPFEINHKNTPVLFSCRYYSFVQRFVIIKNTRQGRRSRPDQCSANQPAQKCHISFTRCFVQFLLQDYRARDGLAIKFPRKYLHRDKIFERRKFTDSGGGGVCIMRTLRAVVRPDHFKFASYGPAREEDGRSQVCWFHNTIHGP